MTKKMRSWKAMHYVLPIMSIVMMCFLAAGLGADDNTSVETELESFKLHAGFEINLYAAESDGIINPLCMRWDPRGRLYVACSTVYPQLRPGEIPHDKIIVLEDTNQDGRADKSTVFVDGLNIPTGIEIGDGGVYVGQETELLLLKDTDGDGRADTREIVLSGFGTGDTHQAINSFVWSPGGELFFGQGDGIESRVETPWGLSTLYQAGVFRLRPRRLQLHGFLDDFMGPGNPWGIAFDDWGQAFVVDGAGGISFLTPAMLPVKHRLTLQTIGKPGGYCGVEILGSRHLPDEFLGDFLVGDFQRNMVSRFAVQPNGSGFRVVWKEPLLHATQRNFRPVDIRSGPDGAVYICDWYNPIICHQDDPFRHPDRDRTHGRIWRITASHRPLVERPELVGTSLPRLLEYLKSPERWTRYQAKRVLADMDRTEVADAFHTWLGNIDRAAIDRNSPAFQQTLLEALGALESLEIVQPALLQTLLRSEDHRARAYATRVIGRWHDRLDDPLALLASSATDDHPLVRLEAVVACAHIPSPHSVEVAAIVVDKPLDRDIEYALTQSVHQLKSHWLPAFAAGQVNFGGNARRMAAVLKTIESPEILASLHRLALTDDLDANTHVAVLQAIVRIGLPRDLRVAFNVAIKSHRESRDGIYSQVLDELGDAFRSEEIQPEGDLVQTLQRLIEQPEVRMRTASIELAGTWKLQPLYGDILRIARDAHAHVVTRQAATNSLAQLGGEAAEQALNQLAVGADSMQLRVSAIAALCQMNTRAAANYAAQLLTDAHDPEIDLATLMRAFLSKNNGTNMLAAALEHSDVEVIAASRIHQAMSSAGRSDSKLMAVLHRAIGLSNQVEAYRPQFVQELALEVMRDGEAARGELVFRSKFANCYSCHRIGGAGGWIGPDLSAVGTTLPLDRLILEVVWPHRQIKEGYSLLQIVTEEGRVHQGYERDNDADDLLVLQELTTGRHVRILRDAIEVQREVGTAMPANITAGLTRTQLRDLVRFLTELGSPGPYAVDKTPTIRHWQVLTSRLSRIEEGPFDNDQLVWRTVYSRVSGMLELNDLGSHAGSDFMFVRNTFEISRPQRRRLRLNSGRGLRLWLDNRRIHDDEDAVLDLDAGTHQLVFRIDVKTRSDGLRAKWSE